MAHLIAPDGGDAHLRTSFVEAMREHQAADGRPDAGGLTIADLSGPTCFANYARGLREGTALRPGTTPMQCCEWWWIEPAGMDGPEYIGRISLRDQPAPGGGHLTWSVRPSCRGRGHDERMLAAVLPILSGRGLPDVTVVCRTDHAHVQRAVEAVGGHLDGGAAGRLRYVLAAS